jgi:large subunit ribosomal protein L29
MKAKEIREMTKQELAEQLVSIKEELFNLRFQQATGQLENPMRIKEIKKDYARVKTILRQRELETLDA